MLFWHLERFIPRNRYKWVFGAWFGDKYADNSRYLYEYVLKEKPSIKAIWLTNNKSVFNRLNKENKPVAMLSSLKGKLFALTSKFAFITVERKEVNGFYLNGAKLIWLYHGMLMKYVMDDEKRFIEQQNPNKHNIRRSLSNFMFPYLRGYNVGSIIVTSEFFKPFFSSAFNVDTSKVWCDGYPRNDEFFTLDNEKIIQKYRVKYPSAKFIIHMPTHRIHGLKGSPFNPFEGYGFDQANFIEVLEKGNYVYFYKGHFYDTSSNVSIKCDRFVRITDQDFDSLYKLIKDMDIQVFILTFCCCNVQLSLHLLTMILILPRNVHYIMITTSIFRLTKLIIGMNW